MVEIEARSRPATMSPATSPAASQLRGELRVLGREPGGRAVTSGSNAARRFFSARLPSFARSRGRGRAQTWPSVAITARPSESLSPLESGCF